MAHFLEWFGKNVEKDILEKSVLHMDSVYEAVRMLKSAITCFTGKNDKKELEGLLHRIATAEHEADGIRKKLIYDIAIGEILPPDHSELIAFINEIDGLADRAHSAARCMALWKGEFLVEARPGLEKISEIALASTEKLREALVLVRDRKKSKQKIVEICHEIEHLEDRGDDAKRELMEMILNSQLSVGKIFTAKDMVEAIENICDGTKHCADMLGMIMIKL